MTRQQRTRIPGGLIGVFVFGIFAFVHSNVDQNPRPKIQYESVTREYPIDSVFDREIALFEIRSSGRFVVIEALRALGFRLTVDESANLRAPDVWYVTPQGEGVFRSDRLYDFKFEHCPAREVIYEVAMELGYDSAECVQGTNLVNLISSHSRIETRVHSIRFEGSARALLDQISREYHPMPKGPEITFGEPLIVDLDLRRPRVRDILNAIAPQARTVNWSANSKDFSFTSGHGYGPVDVVDIDHSGVVAASESPTRFIYSNVSEARIASRGRVLTNLVRSW